MAIGLTVKAARKHFPESEETQKGHMKAQKSGIRLTKRKKVSAVSEPKRRIRMTLQPKLRSMM